MADNQPVYESIAQTMRDYGYRDVTAAVVREVDEGATEDQGVISLFAGRQLEQARESGLLPPAADAAEPPQPPLDAE